MLWYIIWSAILFAACENNSRIPVPCQKNDYCHIYKPEGDTFPGPTTYELTAGKWYKEWVPNDHTFIRDRDGFWHIFGITHPLTSTDRVHEGEFMSFHAVSPAAGMQASLLENSWKDLPKVLAPSERKEEFPVFNAPHIIRKDDLYYMFYSPNPIRLAVSRDLMNWEPQGILFDDAPWSRDPAVLLYKGIYHMVYCSENRIKLRISEDLQHWDEASDLLCPEEFIPESPFLVRHGRGFYLFVCAWDRVWDRKEVSGAYQHLTYVYYSDKLCLFDHSRPITILNAHAPEIFRGENGQWYLSSAEWPSRGVSLDRLSWE